MKAIHCIIVLFFSLTLSSCGVLTWYTNTLVSRGYTPNEKTYHVSSPDSAWTSTLEFKEYAQNLKQRLNEVGYIESSPKDAALCILLDYSIGEPYLEGTTSYSSTSTYANTTLNQNTSASASASSSVSKSGNKVSSKADIIGNAFSKVKVATYGQTGTSESSYNIYKKPLLVTISAIDNKSKEPVWEVIVNDDISRESQLQSVMPWLFLSVQPYFGTPSNGEVKPRVNNTTENRAQYNLVWPY